MHFILGPGLCLRLLGARKVTVCAHVCVEVVCTHVRGQMYVWLTSGRLEGTISSAEASWPPTGRRLAGMAGLGPFSGPEWCRDLAKAAGRMCGRSLMEPRSPTEPARGGGEAGQLAVPLQRHLLAPSTHSTPTGPQTSETPGPVTLPLPKDPGFGSSWFVWLSARFGAHRGLVSHPGQVLRGPEVLPQLGPGSSPRSL